MVSGILFSILRPFYDVIAEPLRELSAINLAGSGSKNNLLLLIDRSGDLQTVQNKESFHRGVADAFVAVNKGVVLNEGKSEGRSFVHQCGVKIFPTECHTGLSEGRLKAIKIVNANTSPGSLHDSAI